MTAEELKTLLTAVQAGKVDIDSAVRTLGSATVADLGFATLDLHRQHRCGFPEVILAEGKTPEWCLGAVQRLAEQGLDCFATRVNGTQADLLQQHFPNAEQDRIARTFWLPNGSPRDPLVGDVLVVTAGTGDLPVAYEAVRTLNVLGVKAELIADVGVAGIHRILRHRQRLAQADAVIVCAGMDGALPSVVGGLIDSPVIAVPTSIGYGAAFGGVAALLTMLNSCSAGVTAVNIDAGFKAGYCAALIARRLARKPA